VRLSLHTASPGESGSTANEVSTSGTGYARQTSLLWSVSTGSVLNSGSILWGPATASWGTVSYVGIHDDSGSQNMLFYLPITDGIGGAAPKTPTPGDDIFAGTGAILVDLRVSPSKFFIFDFCDKINGNIFLHGTSDTSPPTALKVRLHTSTPGPSTPDDGLVSGNGYADQTITFGAPSGGSMTNNAVVTFPSATASWGTVTHFSVVATAPAALALMWGTLDTSRAVATGDIITFPIGSLTLTAQ
jgi:hypothetical protein